MAQTPATAFHRFPQLPTELRIEIIQYALISVVSQHHQKQKLTIRLIVPPTAYPRHTRAVLPSLPALYHTNQLFRYESLRLAPLTQIFLTTTSPCDPLTSLALFNPALDILELDTRYWSYKALSHDPKSFRFYHKLSSKPRVLAALLDAFTREVKTEMQQLHANCTTHTRQMLEQMLIECVCDPSFTSLRACQLEHATKRKCGWFFPRPGCAHVGKVAMNTTTRLYEFPDMEGQETLDMLYSIRCVVDGEECNHFVAWWKQYLKMRQRGMVVEKLRLRDERMRGRDAVKEGENGEG